ncbi:SOS response-associated peptidase [Kribbella sp. CWNU-51]
MCGRYASTRSREDLLETFKIEEALADEEKAPDYNVAPTKTSPTVLARPPRGADEETDPVRQLRNLKWGLVPSWAKDPKIGNRLINARAETVHEKPAFRRAFKSRRLLIPVDGFYEWFPTQQLGKSGKPLKQPFYIHPANPDDVLALAGLYEFWRDPDKADDDPNKWLTSFTIITTTATDDVGRIHDRMPMAVTPDNWEQWLDPGLDDVETIQGLMAPPAALEVYAISKAVNDVTNNGPELLEPVPAEPAAGESE